MTSRVRRTSTYANILTFFPLSFKDKKIEYIEGTDYSKDLLNSPFTLTNSTEIVNFITKKAGSNLIIVINYKYYALPLIISLLLNKNIYYIFIYTEENAKENQYLVNVIINLNVGNGCQIIDTLDPDLSMKDLTYIAIDESLVKIPSKGGSHPLHASFTIKSLEGIEIYPLRIESRNKEEVKFETGNIKVAGIVDNNLSEFADNPSDPEDKSGEKYRDWFENKIKPFNEQRYERKAIQESTKRETEEPVSIRRSRTRVIPVEKEPEEEVNIRYSERNKSTTRPSSNNEDRRDRGRSTTRPDTENKSSPIRRGRSTTRSNTESTTKKDEENAKVKRIYAASPVRNARKRASSTAPSRFRGGSISSEEEEDLLLPSNTLSSVKRAVNPNEVGIVKGDKYYLISRPNHDKIKKPKSERPTKGGFFEYDNYVLNFYVVGADDLKIPAPGVISDINKYTPALKGYLQDLLSLFISDDKAVLGMTVDELMPEWIKVWTSETYDIDENYEILEILGDGALSYVFQSFMYENDDTLNEAELTALKIKCCDKGTLRRVGWELKMDKWVRMGSNALVTTNISEDIVEAFCAMLQNAGSYYLKSCEDKEAKKEFTNIPGMGIKYIYQFISFLFGKAEFPQEMYEIDLKTAILQAAEILTGNRKIHAIQEIDEADEKLPNGTIVKVVTLVWAKEAMRYFKQNGYKNVEEEITTAKGLSRKRAIHEAYDKAIKKLSDIGLPISKLRQLKEEANWERYDKDLYDDALAKVRKDYKNKNITLKITAPSNLTTTTVTTVLLLANIPDGSRRGRTVKLAGNTGPSGNIIEMGNDLLEEYLEK